MVLNGWKEIAKHLRIGVRTAQRWESMRIGLPIHRPKHDGIVCAFSEELDEWMRMPRPALVDQDGRSDPRFRYRVLLVDDDEQLLSTAAAILTDAGFDVRTAHDGFHALAVMRQGGVPELLVSDLKMPNMSGFELLTVVRKRFPAVSVIAMSGDFTPVTPPAVLADVFLDKGDGALQKLVSSARELLSQSPLRAQLAKPRVAPAWIPHDGNGYIVITCTDCLRSFSVSEAEVQSATADFSSACIHCGVLVPFRVDATAKELVKEVLIRRLNTTAKSRRASFKSEVADAGDGEALPPLEKYGA